MASEIINQVINQFLYGSTSTPGNLVDNNLIRAEGAKTSYQINGQEFMNPDNGPGRFALAPQFKIIEYFFEAPNESFALQPREEPYSKQELQAFFQLESSNLRIDHKNYQDNFDDYSERVFLYNNQIYQISDDTKFFVKQINPEGERIIIATFIENLSIEIIPDTDDWNFETSGADVLTQSLNVGLELLVDPSKIGRTVDFNYVDFPKLNYNRDAYDKDKEKILTWDRDKSLDKLLFEIRKISVDLFNDSITRFVTQEEKQIFYGTNNNNTISALESLNNFVVRNSVILINPTAFTNNGIVLLGGNGNDSLIDDRVSSTSDEFYAGAGNDFLFTGLGDDILDGGDGSEDTAVFSGSFEEYKFSISSGLQTLKIEHFGGTRRDGIDTLANIEFLRFADRTIPLTNLIDEGDSDGDGGGDGSNGEGNPIKGSKGDDQLFGGEGDNNLFGDDGNDSLYGGSANDRLNGGDGNDILFGNEGRNNLLGGTGDDIIYGGSNEDLVDAGNGINQIYAAEGNNLISSGSGNDVVYGGSGSDWIFTGAGDDTIYAAEGNNLIAAGSGNNIVYSGSGQDLFILVSGAGATTINQFQNNDRLGFIGGLSFDELSINRVESGNEFSTNISISSTGDLLASIKWVEPSSITRNSFVNAENLGVFSSNESAGRLFLADFANFGTETGLSISLASEIQKKFITSGNSFITL